MVSPAQVQAKSEVELDIENCARCGNDHENLTFHRFSNPPRCTTQQDKELLYTHWAECPVQGAPVLLRPSESNE